MKHYKPGQFMYINNHLFRAKRRTYGCNGCDLNNIFLCPMATDRRFEILFDCAIDNIILKRM